MKVITRVEYDVGLLAKQVCKLNVNKRRKPKANVAKPETKTPSIVALCFRPKVSIVVYRKKAIGISTKKKNWIQKTVDAFNFVYTFQESAIVNN